MRLITPEIITRPLAQQTRRGAHGKLSRKSQTGKFYLFDNKIEKFDEEQDDIQFVKPRVMDAIEEDEVEEPVSDHKPQSMAKNLCGLEVSLL